MPTTTAAPIRLSVMVDVNAAQIDAAVKQSTDRMVSHFADAANEINAILRKLSRPGGIIETMPGAAALTPPATPSAGRAPSNVWNNPVMASFAAANGFAVPSGAVGLFQTLAQSATAATQPIAALPGLILKIGTSLPSIASAVYLFRSLGSAVESYLVSPIERAARAMIEATEESRKFEYAIAGVAGMDRARAINRAIVNAGRDLPVPVREIRDSARTLTFIPALADRISTGTPADAAAQAIQFANLARRLGVIDPEQGESGAVIALRELAQGQAVSIRRRFGLDLPQIAHAIGKQPSDLNRDPALAFQGLEKLVDALIPASAADRFKGLISTRTQQLRDAYASALARIGDSGVFDSTVGRLEKLGKQLFAYLDSPAFTATASRVSASLDRIVGNVGAALDRLLRKLTGTRADTSTVAGVATAIADGIDRLAALSDNLPGIFDRVGGVLHDIGTKLVQFVDSVILLADAARDPAAYASGVAGRTFTPNPAYDPAGGNRATLDILRRAGIDTARIGTQFYEPHTNADDVYAEARKAGSGVISSFFQAVPEALRELVRSRVPAEVLDFHRLDPGQQLYAQQIYAAVREGRQPDADLLAKLRTASGRPAAPDPFADFHDLNLYRLTKDEYGGPNYAATLQSQAAAMGRLSDLTEHPDATRKLAETSAGAMNPAVIGKLREQMDDAIGLIDSAIGEARDRLRQVGANDTVQGWITEFDDHVRARVLAGFDTAQKLATDNLIAAARSFGKGLSEALAGTPLTGDFQRQIADGTTGYARRLADALDLAPADVAKRAGLDSLRVDEAQAVAARLNSRRLDDADLYAKIGIVRPGYDASAIKLAYANRPDSFAAAGIQLRAVQGESLPTQERVLNRANAGLSANPDDPLAVKDAAEAARAYGELLAKLDELKIASSRLGTAFREFGTAAREALEHSVGDAIYDLITGTGKLADALKSFAMSITRAFSDIVASAAVRMVLSMFLPSGAKPYFGIPTVAAKADGGTFDGGIRFFSDGGTVQAGRPVIGVVGEGSMNEAIVPMPDGRSIPIEWRDGGFVAVLPKGRSIPAKLSGTRMYADGGVIGQRYAGIGHDDIAPAYAGPSAVPVGTRSTDDDGRDGGNVYVVHNVDEAWKLGFNQNRDKIVDLVSGNVRNGGKIARQMRRAS